MAKRILIINSDIQLIRQLIIELKGHNYDFITAYDGIQGIKMIHELKPDLIIYDFKVPAGGGMNFISNLQRLPELALIPIIVTSVPMDEEKIEKLMQMGAKDQLYEPLDHKKLYGKVISCLEEKVPTAVVASEPLNETATLSKYGEDFKFESTDANILINARKILIVDDDQDVLKGLEEFFKLKEFEVVTAKDGEEALNKARNENPGLIILDIMLPKIDGFRVSRLLKFDKNYKNIPIIMLSAKGTEKDRELGKACGADLYLVKPVDFNSLLEKVNTFLKQRK